jgi:RHS repeat-associated protein
LQLYYDEYSDRISSITDPLGRYIAFGYGDFNKRLIAAVDSAGNRTKFEYTFLGFLTQLGKIIDPRGNVAKEITYNPAGRVIKQQFADGGFETYEYTLSGAVVTQTKITDPLGRVMIKRFNANGYVIEQTDSAGQRAIIDRDLNNNLSKSTKGSCGCTEENRKFDERGNKTETTDQLGNLSKNFYEPIYNNVTKTIDKLGRETNFAYDTNGNLTSVTDILGRTSGANYDNFGRLIGTTDALSQTESFEYDASGFMTARVDKLGKRWTMVYDAVGRMLSQSDPLNRSSIYTYDSLDRVVTITDAAGAVTTFTYDENSSRTKVTDRLGRIWRSFYDKKNRLIRTVDPIGRISRRTYNIGDEMTKVTSPSLREMRYEYDQRGQAVKIFDGLGNASNYTYDYERKLKTIQDKRGNTTSFEYDELDRPTLQRNPLGQSSSAKYDSLGKVTESTDELGRRTNFTYDTVNRMTNIAYADAQVGYTYDTLNRITQISDTQGGTLNWSYDALGQVQSETTANGSVNYTYNDARQKSSMTALNRPSVNYGYDSAGRLANITQGSETFGYNYDSISRMTSLTRPNGVNTNYEYDQVNRLKRMTHGTIEDFKYEYNIDNEISSINSLNSATQLPTAKNSSGANNANRITQFGDSTFSFDEKGQSTTQTNSSGTSTYNWDVRGRLKNVALPNGETVNYNYDVLGRRTSRTSSNQTTNFVYDGADVVQDKQGSNNVNYLNGLGIDDKLKVDNKYFLKDHLGSTIGLTNTSGNLVESQKYEAFGKATGSLSTRYGYTGREYDADTKLNYYRARWYDAEQGRFLSSDPIGFKAGENFYSYVGNSPMNKKDPSGLFPSMGVWQYHQHVTFMIATEHVTPQKARMMANEQYDFDSETQDEVYSPWHAMRKRNQSPEDARRLANQFIRNQICLARNLKGLGHENQALRALSRAMHTLQDSSSPAHYDFQPAWEDTTMNRLKELFGGHYWKENFLPGEGSIAYEQTRKAWGYYNGNAMPDDFFIDDYHDSPSGRVYSPSQTKRSPDGGSCGCQ